MTSARLGDGFPSVGALVGSDVCLLKAAYPDVSVGSDTVGWRAQVTRHRTTRDGPQVQLFGHWFALEGPCVRPLQPLHTAAPRAAARSIEGTRKRPRGDRLPRKGSSAAAGPTTPPAPMSLPDPPTWEQALAAAGVDSVSSFSDNDDDQADDDDGGRDMPLTAAAGGPPNAASVSS